MAPKLLIICTLLVIVAACCLAQTTDENAPLERSRRGVIAALAEGLGDGLRMFIEGVSVAFKGFFTGATYMLMGFVAGVSNGLQSIRLGVFDFGLGFIALVQNFSAFLFLAPFHSNILGFSRP